jgi:hypothetical protein
MEQKDITITKVGWITQMKSTPPLTKEYIERQYCFFENYVHFLQDNGFTTREILKQGERANDDSEIKSSDLTAEGRKFYSFGVNSWIAKYDRAKDKDKAINDFAFIEKRYDKYSDLHNPCK